MNITNNLGPARPMSNDPVQPGVDLTPSQWTLAPAEGFTFQAFKPPNRLSFRSDDNRIVGEFDFSKSPVTFTGDADASARVFIDAVIRMGLQITPPTP